ncbi:MAG: hypothetical protein EZS28_043006 [Streblomastix strix]|uniref:C2 domain-containing protein n=1 Tax=Streblomastix strix TaxID=222440 RepID=A0A5J4TTA2_9EUKA|nr:MAG: hypothetical protein EZS28_043006 [Streblomastix strix]
MVDSNGKSDPYIVVKLTGIDDKTEKQKNLFGYCIQQCIYIGPQGGQGVRDIFALRSRTSTKAFADEDRLEEKKEVADTVIAEYSEEFDFDFDPATTDQGNSFSNSGIIIHQVMMIKSEEIKPHQKTSLVRRNMDKLTSLEQINISM